MKTTTLIISTVALTLTVAHGQTAINQLDKNGKKDGKWLEYLDSKWKVLKDSSHAVYCAYNYYDHGENTFKIAFNHAYKLYDKLEVTNSNSKTNGKIKILDGEYKWLDNKGRTVSVDYFKNGEHIWSKGYMWERFGMYFGYKKKMTGKLHESYDFTKTYKDQPNTFYFEIYDKDGNTTYWYMRKNESGWAGYPSSKDSN